MITFETVFFTCSFALLLWTGYNDFRKWNEAKVSKLAHRDSLSFRLRETKIGHRADLID